MSQIADAPSTLIAAADLADVAPPAPVGQRDHPFVLQARRHARDVLMSTHRLGAKTGDTSPDATISLALQITLATAIGDGVEPIAAYNALIGAFAWAVCRVPPEQRQDLLGTMVKNVIEAVGQFDDSPKPEPSIN